MNITRISLIVGLGIISSIATPSLGSTLHRDNALTTMGIGQAFVATASQLPLSTSPKKAYPKKQNQLSKHEINSRRPFRMAQHSARDRSRKGNNRQQNIKRNNTDRNRPVIKHS